MKSVKAVSIRDRITCMFKRHPINMIYWQTVTLRGTKQGVRARHECICGKKYGKWMGP
jgi:hypothetical protein